MFLYLCKQIIIFCLLKDKLTTDYFDEQPISLQNDLDFSTVFPTHAKLSSAPSLSVTLIPITRTTEASSVTAQTSHTTQRSQTTQAPETTQPALTTDSVVTFGDDFNSTLNQSLATVDLDAIEQDTTEPAPTTQRFTTEAAQETVHIAIIIRACAVTGEA